MEKQVIIISEQLIPNFIPLYSKKEQVSFIYAVVTKEMIPKYQVFERICKKYNWPVTKIEVSSYQYQEIYKKLDKSLPQEKLLFNLTGGTKLMILGAYEFCRKRNISSIYVDTFNQKIFQITPQFKEEHLPDVLNLENYLALYGYNIVEKETEKVDSKFKKALAFFLKTLSKNKGNFTLYNSLSSQAEKNLSAQIIKNHNHVKKIFYPLSKFGIVEIQEDKNEIIFKGEKERFFCNGGWLEDYVYNCLWELKEKGIILDLAKNVVITDHNNNKNELDIAFCCKNKLYIIECKTSKFEKANPNSQKDSNYIYKLEAIKSKAGGIFGTPIFITLNTSKHLLNRAKSWNIRVIPPEKFNNLQEEIQKII